MLTAGPTAEIAASICASTGSTICAPPARYTFSPLSSGGLWDAVTCSAAAALR